MNILVVCKGQLDNAVPIISISQGFNALGHAVSIICSNISDGLAGELQSDGIKVISLRIEENYTYGIAVTKALKIRHWKVFRSKAWQIIQKNQADVLYIATADTAIALYGLLSGLKYILHLRELYDQHPHYMRLLKKLAGEATTVVVPEENRAYLYYSMLGLNQLPVVIPNKPFHHPRETCLPLEFLDNEMAQQLREKKNILYQGALHKERDLRPLLSAAKTLDDYNVIIMGKDYGLLETYLKINPSLIYIPFVRPPLHLNITSWAHIGIITYDLQSLNTIYCAPNKIWEYSGFGIPILANSNPGVSGIIRKSGAGIIVDFDNESKIINGIRAMEDHYEFICNNSRKLYDSVDLGAMLSELLENNHK